LVVSVTDDTPNIPQRKLIMVLKLFVVMRDLAHKDPYTGIKEIGHHWVETGDDKCAPIHKIPHLSKRNTSDHPISTIL